MSGLNTINNPGKTFFSGSELFARAKTSLYVFFCGILPVLIFWLVVPFRESDVTDYQAAYAPAARNLLAGNGLTANGTELLITYPPGYPLLLAAIFKIADLFSVSSRTVLLLFTLLCYGLSAVLVFMLARGVWDKKSSLLVAITWISYLPILWLTTGPFSEIPFLVFFYLSLCLFLYAVRQHNVGWYWYFLSGLCAGCAALVRPVGLVIGMALILAVWWSFRNSTLRLRLSLTVLLILGNLVATLPWQSYVYAKTGKVILLSTALVPGVRDGLRFAVNPKGYRSQIKVPEDVRAMTERIHARYDEMNNFRQVVAVVADESRARPLTLCKLIIIKAARSWYATDSGQREPVILLLQIFYLGFALWGAWRARRLGTKHRQLLILIAGLLFLFWGMTILVLSILRYMAPAIGLLFLLLPGIWTGRKDPGDEPCPQSA